MSSPPNHGGQDAATVLSERAERPRTRASSFSLSIADGPDAGEPFTIEPSLPSRLLIGQSPSCALRLSDRQVSRRHLACELEGDLLRVTDLESTNGTWVNGLRINDVLLSGGETILLGTTRIDVTRLGAATEVALTAATSFGRLVGASAAMRKIYPICKKLAAAAVPVVIEGETGTGKEVLAESLHETGPRARGPFVVFDCTAVPPNLVESALFGHERGAFTGATEARKGVFEEADGGTLLIDEIGDLAIELQAKLLRALERSEVCRIGSNKWVRVDVRIIAATRRDLDRAVQDGRFRDDLFYRLAVTRIELPPLRKRHGDVAILADFFWGRLADPGDPLPHEFMAQLEGYQWPGNVRELQNSVARRVALGELADAGGAVGPASMSLMASADAGAAPAAHVAVDDVLERVLALNLPLPRARRKLVAEFETRYVARVLEQHGGNVARAAAASGIARRYFRLLRARSRRRSEEEEE
jgi:DNA-binding NtrC family response regulator